MVLPGTLQMGFLYTKDLTALPYPAHWLSHLICSDASFSYIDQDMRLCTQSILMTEVPFTEYVAMLHTKDQTANLFCSFLVQ